TGASRVNSAARLWHPCGQGHERQRQAPARWPATLQPRWGAPGDDLAGAEVACGKRGPAGPSDHRRIIMSVLPLLGERTEVPLTHPLDGVTSVPYANLDYAASAP